LQLRPPFCFFYLIKVSLAVHYFTGFFNLSKKMAVFSPPSSFFLQLRPPFCFLFLIKLLLAAHHFTGFFKLSNKMAVLVRHLDFVCNYSRHFVFFFKLVFHPFLRNELCVVAHCFKGNFREILL